MSAKRTEPSRVLSPRTTTWVSYRDALGMFLHGATLWAATPIAVVVGTWLSLMNQGHLIVQGNVSWLKLVINYMTPFAVASWGFLAARQGSSIERLAALIPTDHT
jgi:hypothetical protein